MFAKILNVTSSFIGINLQNASGGRAALPILKSKRKKKEKSINNVLDSTFQAFKD